jgi:hypothetical protein
VLVRGEGQTDELSLGFRGAEGRNPLFLVFLRPFFALSFVLERLLYALNG